MLLPISANSTLCTRSGWPKESLKIESLPGWVTCCVLLVQVRRGQHLVHDTLLQIQNAGLNVRKPLKVQFFGEEGVDEGGVQKVRPELCAS